MNHPTFDIDTWKARLTGTAVAELERIVFRGSPIGIVTVEHYREAAAVGGELGPTVPVDVFVFGKGEPPARHLTKVNGLPYRPAGVPWPHDCMGRPMTFLAQFCFGDSMDHVGDLPGDVLLLFMRTRPGYPFTDGMVPLVDPREDVDSLVFEWYPLGLENLVQPEDVPGPPLVFPTCFGVRYRTCDYLDEESSAQVVSRVVPENILPTHEFYRDATLRAFCRYPQMKIGGAPFWYERSREPRHGRFVASFSDVNLAVETPFPWTNRTEPLDLDEGIAHENLLLFHDGSCINYFLGDDGKIDWHAQFL